MVTLRALSLDDAAALTRVYSGASSGTPPANPLTLDQAHEKADGVAVVRMFLADRLGLFLQGEEAMDRIDDAVRKLIEVRGPVGTADVVTVLASQVASLLAANARPDGDPEACSTR
ncbi:hypothetical protein [Streptomyces globisporus]|uniref:hypothetical protein n=1 Tax=Streptomyces globisporus TaxID=1908 RepID=UPI0004C9C00D|nr:hypothetical protein [Streptomyces globisporus]